MPYSRMCLIFGCALFSDVPYFRDISYIFADYIEIRGVSCIRVTSHSREKTVCGRILGVCLVRALFMGGCYSGVYATL